ncbi:3-oxoadipate enol-lactonase [Glycomyces buryatensis]|nr:3-oxoadipate enol-lactonase [Glycomyces buryatensis]
MIPHHVTDGDGETVVLINSLGTTIDMWEPQVGPLSERFRVVRFDTRGHGRTPTPPGEWTVDDLAGDIIDLLDHLGARNAHLVGVSLGGATAMALAEHYPDRVGRLALISAATRIGTYDSWRDRATTVRANGCQAVSAGAMDRWFSPAFHRSHPETVAAFRERFDACDPEGYAGCCDAIGRMDLSGALGHVTAETLIVVGTDDEVTTVADARFLAEGIRGSRLVPVPGGKHLLTAEFADLTNRLLVDFLTSSAATA